MAKPPRSPVNPTPSSAHDLLPPGEAPWPDLGWIERRPPPRPGQLEEVASYLPDPDLRAAVNLALTLGDPLLVTGEPGTGKSQLAYWAARALRLGQPEHFQVRSTSAAKELLYTFDTIAYFRSAQVERQSPGAERSEVDKERFIQRGPLWKALESPSPKVLLIDEIDKAPRDFPNDLLHELDQMAFKVPELDAPISREGEKPAPETITLRNPKNRPLVIITSNSEHRLPEAFLRRCIYHHIQLTPAFVYRIVEKRRADFAPLRGGLLELAVDRFLQLRATEGIGKRPSTHELLVWLRALSMWTEVSEGALTPDTLDRLPYVGLLLKNREGQEAAAAQRPEETAWLAEHRRTQARG